MQKKFFCVKISQWSSKIFIYYSNVFSNLLRVCRYSANVFKGIERFFTMKQSFVEISQRSLTLYFYIAVYLTYTFSNVYHTYIFICTYAVNHIVYVFVCMMSFMSSYFYSWPYIWTNLYLSAKSVKVFSVSLFVPVILFICHLSPSLKNLSLTYYSQVFVISITAVLFKLLLMIWDDVSRCYCDVTRFWHTMSVCLSLCLYL